MAKATKQSPITITVSGLDEFVGGVKLGIERSKVPFARGVRGRIGHDIAAENTQAFKSTGRSLGVGWRPLTEPYASWKSANYPGRPLLVRRGRMRQGMTNPQHPDFKLSQPSRLKLSWQLNSRYAGYHQTGTPRMASRVLVKPTRVFAHRVGLLVMDGITGVNTTGVRELFGD